MGKKVGKLVRKRFRPVPSESTLKLNPRIEVPKSKSIFQIFKMDFDSGEMDFDSSALIWDVRDLDFAFRKRM